MIFWNIGVKVKWFCSLHFFVLHLKEGHFVILQQGELFYQKIRFNHIMIKCNFSSKSNFTRARTLNFPGKTVIYSWEVVILKPQENLQPSCARVSGHRSIPREFSHRLAAVWSGRLECKSRALPDFGGDNMCLNVQLRAISSQSLRELFLLTN